MKRVGYRKTWIAAAFLSFVFTALMVLSAFMPMFSTAYAEEDENVETVTVDGAKAYILNGAVRIMPLSGGIVRLEEKGKNGFEDRDTYYVLGRDGFTAPESEYTVTAAELVVTTGRYVVHIPKEATDLTGAFVTDAEGTTLYRYNGVTLPNTYLPTPSEDLRGWYFSDNPRIVPGDRGYSIHNDGLELNGWDFENEAPDVYVFVPESYTEFCEDYVTLTGKSNLVDLKTLGYWDSRWVVYNDEMALQQIQDYLDRGYSIDVLVIDTNWRKGDVNQTPGMDPSVGGMGYEIDKGLFPNMAEFLEKAHEMGVNIIFNDHPEPKKGTDNGLDKEEIEFRSKSLKGILSLGLDMWWYDRNWHTALKSADNDLSVYAWGMYAFQFIENEYYEDLVSDEDALQEYARRAIIMGNVDGCENGYWKYGSDLTAHRYTIQWTGDIGVDEAALGREINNAVFAGVESGIPYVSADLGGHTASVTDDMYARWLQYGALSTITRVHCTHEAYCGQEGRMPWLFGETAENVTKEYVGMKYNLMPVYYSLAGENARTGLPIMRRLDVKYPQYAEASRNDEYLLGDGILIAPINEAMGKPAIPENFFTYTDAKGITRSGLLGSYYNNTSAEGTPVYTQTDEQFVFDWGQAGPLGLAANNFSIRWEGKFKVGAAATKLTFFADDRVQVRIDNKLVVNSYDETTQSNSYDKLFETEEYAPGSEHTIEIKYVEEGNYAHFYMYCIEKPAQGASICYDTRDVFFPDGTWIDVWSGKEYEGPYTYSVTYPLETSPVFVRKGALNVLAPDMSNLSEKDWSELTLDAYPSASRAETSLYEDDTATQAYKYGHYRTTAISAGEAEGKYTITIGAAEGEFTGKKAFAERKWNIRLHAFEELGEVINVTVNGKPVSGMSYFSRNSLASPFSFTGASADTAVYMFSFTGSVKEETVIVIDFENNAKLATFGKNAQYDATAADFDVDVSDEVNGWIDLDSDAYEDWAYFGNVTSRKGGAEHVIGDISSDFELWSGSTAAICADWTRGEGRDGGDGVSVGVAAQVYEDVTLQVKKGASKVYTLYLMAEQCIGKLTIRDRAGNVQTILLDKPARGLSSTSLNNNLNGRSVFKVTIAVSAEADTELYIHYGMHSVRPNGAASNARVGITAIVYGDAAAEDSELTKADVAQATITQETVPSQVNLSEYAGGEVLDWYKSNYGVKTEVYKQGGEAIRSVDFTQQNSFGDYKSSISWTDGEEVASCTGTTNGYHTQSNGNIRILVNVDASTKYIVLYVGAWRGSTQVTLQNYKGEARGSVSFTAGEDSVCQKIVIPISVEEATRVTVLISSVNAVNDGNASLAALQVVGG